MSQISINVDNVLENAGNIPTLIRTLSNQLNTVTSVRQSLDPRILSSSGVAQQLDSTCQRLSDVINRLMNLQNFMQNSANEYRDTDNQLNKEFGELNSQTQSVYNSLVEDTTAKDNTGAKSIFGDIEAAWSDVAGFAQEHKKALIIAAAAVALIAVGIATCGVGDAVLAPALAAALGMGAIGAGTGLAGEEISDYMDDGKIDNTDQSYLGTAAGGFVTGALIPVGGTEAVGLKGIATQAAKNGLAGMVGNTVQQQISTGKVDEKEVLETGVVSGVLTGAAYGIGGSLKSSVVNNASEDVGNAKTVLDYVPSSGVELKAIPNVTTTVLGNYTSDTKSIIEELGNVKSTDFGPRTGGFNLLNTPDDLYQSPEQFWNNYNKPWLDNAISRGDKIVMVTKPTPNVLYKMNQQTGEMVLTGLGMEYNYLLDNGYTFDKTIMQMIPN